MHCPFCGNQETKVVDSRLAGDGYQIRRRRECVGCSERFTTFESAEFVLPKLITLVFSEFVEAADAIAIMSIAVIPEAITML